MEFLRHSHHGGVVAAIAFVVMSLALAACGGAASGSSAPSAAASEAAYPTKPVEFVVQTGPGGGSDIFARFLAQIINENELADQQVVVVNKEGGSGAVALEYLAQLEDTSHTLFAVPGAGILTNVARGRTSFDDFKQVGVYSLEPNVVITYADAPYESISDLVEASQVEPLKQVGAAVGGGGHLAGYLLAEAADMQVEFISFESGGEAINALLGANGDFAIESPGEALELERGGRVRILGSMTSDRLDVLPDTPTLAEEGYDVTFEIPRGVAMMADVSDDVIGYWEGVFEAAFATDEFQAFAADNGLVYESLNSDEADALFRDQYAALETVLEEIAGE